MTGYASIRSGVRDGASTDNPGVGRFEVAVGVLRARCAQISPPAPTTTIDTAATASRSGRLARVSGVRGGPDDELIVEDRVEFVVDGEFGVSTAQGGW